MNFIFMVHTKVALENSKNCLEKCVILIAFRPASGRAWPPKKIKGKKRRRRTNTNQNRQSRHSPGQRGDSGSVPCLSHCHSHRHNMLPPQTQHGRTAGLGEEGRLAPFHLLKKPHVEASSVEAHFAMRTMNVYRRSGISTRICPS